MSLAPEERLDQASNRGEFGVRIVHTWRDGVSVRTEPFDAIELDLSILLGDVIRRTSRANRS